MMIKTTVLACLAVLGCSKSEKTDKPADKPADPPAKVADKPADPPPATNTPPPSQQAPTPPPETKQDKPILKVEMPGSWQREDSAGSSAKLETYEAVNSSSFPVDNAVFQFEMGPVIGDNLPKDLAGYGEWLAKTKNKKVAKTEKLADGMYFEIDGEFEVVKQLDGALYRCGGSLYKGGDYAKIPKESAKAVAEAKKVCSSMKL